MSEHIYKNGHSNHVQCGTVEGAHERKSLMIEAGSSRDLNPMVQLRVASVHHRASLEFVFTIDLPLRLFCDGNCFAIVFGVTVGLPSGILLVMSL